MVSCFNHNRKPYLLLAGQKRQAVESQAKTISKLRQAIVKMVRHIRRSSLVACDSGDEVRKMSKNISKSGRGEIMSETETEVEGQKPKTSLLAMVALILPVSLSVIGFTSGFFSEIFPYHGSNLISAVESLGWLLIWGSPCIGLFIGIMAESEISKSRGTKTGKLLAVLGFAIPLLLLIVAIKVAAVLRGA